LSYEPERGGAIWIADFGLRIADLGEVPNCADYLSYEPERGGAIWIADFGLRIAPAYSADRDLGEVPNCADYLSHEPERGGFIPYVPSIRNPQSEIRNQIGFSSIFLLPK
jgi:hypothetical protein